jgi:hypothetical protein
MGRLRPFMQELLQKERESRTEVVDTRPTEKRRAVVSGDGLIVQAARAPASAQNVWHRKERAPPVVSDEGMRDLRAEEGRRPCRVSLSSPSRCPPGAAVHPRS